MVISFLLILLLTFLFLAQLKKIGNPFFARCLLGAYLIRVMVVLIDLYTDIPVFNSGADSEFFHDEAMQYMKLGYTSGIDNNYDLFLGIIYKITDGSRFFAQYLNVLMGCGIILVMIKLMRKLQVTMRKQNTVVFLASFMPMLIVNSSILLREIWICFFISLSLHCFTNWYIGRRKYKSVLLAVVFVFLSSWMHAGCIFVLVGYFIAFMTYNRKNGSVKISGSTIGALIFMAVVVIVFLTYSSVLGGKLGVLSDFDSEFISQRVEGDTGGGSTYLTWLPLTYSFLDLLFLPIRMFYFLFSPIPTDWRGLTDLVAFIIDSSIYIFLFYYILRGVRRNIREKLLSRYLLVTVLLVAAVFSVGTFQSGNAMRHRAKIVSLLFLGYSISYKKDRLFIMNN